jgi:hypothetical protein
VDCPRTVYQGVFTDQKLGHAFGRTPTGGRMVVRLV